MLCLEQTVSHYQCLGGSMKLEDKSKVCLCFCVFITFKKDLLLPMPKSHPCASMQVKRRGYRRAISYKNDSMSPDNIGENTRTNTRTDEQKQYSKSVHMFMYKSCTCCFCASGAFCRDPTQFEEWCTRAVLASVNPGCLKHCIATLLFSQNHRYHCHMG